ncbi:unannotated protein [freshwater metagenome]|uniref:Unannotated protein n=1 Tax=freshwater metagenome TaxID=449393 RepID=A0A6J7FBG4_9ZZZZ|nr:SMP-30/gluconolactonase/LRE family protein [Actinomycetota bacterium]
MKACDFDIIANTGDQLGEIPTWDEREQALYWIDLLTPRMHRYSMRDGAITSWTTPELLSAFAMREGGGFLVATRSHLAHYDPTDGSFELLVEPEAGNDSNFLNDGRCDRQGRFWIGSGNLDMSQPTGLLHRYDPDGSLTQMESGITLSNSIMWSPDSTLMYFCDSMRREFYVYDFDADTGTIANRRQFATTERHGIPDGSIVDADGFLWNAEFDLSTERTTGFVVRYDPDGNVDRLIELPTCRPTALTFGGANLDTLFVVTSRYRMTDADFEHQPLAGAVFALDVGVRGLVEPRFAG